ncbi:class I SAM-dependent methyltransferase [Bradyrhizobium sp. 174]|uniref:TRM11 family SAM-dependent methyltransferase n=1 Tax=Bradyrhizobium sp. 174 TaxID=2782645 RepID=UPI001FFA5183|nr:class I SAM-dependent methyltransferase [Bradyrhizobium sp. 174]
MGLWSAIEGNVITAAEAAEIAIPSLEHSLPRKARWIAHYDNRLAYERAMLAEQIGTEASANPLADRFAFAVGGQVQAGRNGEWLTVTKVNRGANGSVSSITTTTPVGSRNKLARWRVESVRDYQAPSAESAAAAKAAGKLPPLCNYPGEGFAHLTQAEYDKVPKPYRGYRPRAATDTTGAHRTRAAIGAYAFRGKCDDNKRHSYAAVFITDAKRVDPPKPVPPAEPKEPAEFVREFVAAPDADLDAALSLVSEIMAEPEAVAPLAPVAPAPRPVLVDALASLPTTADLPESSPTADFEAMRAMLKGGGVQVVVAPQLFPTSPELAAEVAELADIRPGHRILEPSAGTGALIEAARVHGAGSLDIVAIEINYQVAQALGRSQQGVTIINGDFMDMAGAVDKFDRIIMNPPFERGADIQHIEHARKFLKPGGRLVAICANGPRQRARLEPIATEWRDLPPGSFKHAGTMVNTALVVIDAPPG